MDNREKPQPELADVYPDGYSGMQHAAHDMRVGRFPKRSAIETYVAEAERNAAIAERDAERVRHSLTRAKLQITKDGERNFNVGDRVKWHNPPLALGTVLKVNGEQVKVQWDTGEVRRCGPDKLRFFSSASEASS